jgi:hypothetical protein
MAQQIKITQTSNADMNIGVPKNLTAVKWLVQWLEDNPISYGNSYNKAIEQAKAMEKEQIVDAYQAGATDMGIIESEQYFNQTYHPNKV